jgi:CubicO group peptidase (beta-lactamase class C family)
VIAGIPDPLRRAKIPKDLDSVTMIAAEEDPTSVGMTEAGVERIWKAVRNLYRSGVHPAVALCIRRDGAVVLDRSIGHAKGNGPHDKAHAEKVLATPETPFCIFSATKATTATLIHVLDERGVLHIGDPVSHYLPEFARNGKSDITIGHVLAHRSGIPNAPKESFDLDRIEDWEYQRGFMYDSRPTSRAGKRQAYHAVSGGAVLGEVVREVTGKPVKQVLAEEILGPLGFRWMSYGVDAEDVDKVGLNYPTGPPAVPPLSTFMTRALGVHPDEATRISNDPRFITACLPAANGMSTANELGRFYEMLLRGGELDGVRVLDPLTLRRALVPQSHLEVDLSLGLPVAFSYGYMLGGRVLSLFGPSTTQAFGHLGWSNVIGWADPERSISVGLITTGKPLFYPELGRFWEVTHRIGKEARPR